MAAVAPISDIRTYFTKMWANILGCFREVRIRSETLWTGFEAQAENTAKVLADLNNLRSPTYFLNNPRIHSCFDWKKGKLSFVSRFLLQASSFKKRETQNKTEAAKKKTKKNLNHLQTHQRQPTSRNCINARYRKSEEKKNKIVSKGFTCVHGLTTNGSRW